MSETHSTEQAEIAALFAAHMPEQGDRKFIFSLLMQSIAFCNKLGSAAWAVTLYSNGFRLNVGQVEAMTCFFVVVSEGAMDGGGDVTLVDVRLLVAGDDRYTKIGKLGEHATLRDMNYKSVGAPHGCYFGTFEAGQDGNVDPCRLSMQREINLINENHQAFLALACRSPTGNLRQRSNFARSHSPALVAYGALAATLGE